MQLECHFSKVLTVLAVCTFQVRALKKLFHRPQTLISLQFNTIGLKIRPSVILRLSAKASAQAQRLRGRLNTPLVQSTDYPAKWQAFL